MLRESYLRPTSITPRKLALGLELTYLKDKEDYLDYYKEKDLSKKDLNQLNKKLEKTYNEVKSYQKKKFFKNFLLNFLLYFYFYFQLINLFHFLS